MTSRALYDPDTGARLLTCKEAADYLDYHTFSIYRLLLQGDLRAHRRLGRSRLFLREELDRYKLSNKWAARKASIAAPVDRPQVPPAQLQATVHVDLGNPLLLHESGVIEQFAWDQVPRIHARSQEQYGQRPAEIRIQGPDGGTWRVTYEPPTWLEQMKQKVRKRQSVK